MVETATPQVPERSLSERYTRYLLSANKGFESMVSSSLSLPALVADGYINMYRAATSNGAYETSDLYGRSKQTITNLGRTADGTKGKVIQAETDTERAIEFGTELVTGLVGPGALKSIKTLAEGGSAINVAAAATKVNPASATVAAEAATTSQTAAKTAAKTADNSIEWSTTTLSAESRASAASQIAANREAAAKAAAARNAGAPAAEAATATNASTAAQAAVTKPEIGYWGIRSFLSRESNFPARLEYLSGRGAQAEEKIAKLLAEARITGISGTDIAVIRNSRTLPQATVEAADKIYAARIGAFLPGKYGAAVESAKGSVNYALTYKWETAAKLGWATAKLPFTAASVALHNPTKAFALGTVGYGAYALLGANPSAAATSVDSSQGPQRVVSTEEKVAETAMKIGIQLSKMTWASLATTGALFAMKLPVVNEGAFNTLRGAARGLISELSEGETDPDRAWDKAQTTLSKVLPDAHLKTLGDFIKGKEMGAEERTRVADALEAMTQPHGDRAKALRTTLVAEAKAKAEEARRLAGPAAAAAIGGGAGAASADGDDAEADGDGDNPLLDMAKGWFGDKLGIDPKHLNSANIWRVTKDLAGTAWDKGATGSNALALGIGALAYKTTDGNKKQKALIGLITTVGMMFLLPAIAPIVMPMLSFLATAMGNMFQSLKEGFAAKFDPKTTKGAFNTEAHAIVNRPRDPSATTPEPTLDSTAAPRVPSPSGEQRVMDMFANAGAGVAHTDKPDSMPKSPDYVLASTSVKHEPALKL